jgi:hypothetical protein
VALVFWKDSLDFTRIIKQQKDQIEPKGGFGYGASPDRQRANQYKKTADEVQSQMVAKGGDAAGGRYQG